MVKILGISPTYLSLLINGKRGWRGDLKERYKTLVNTFVNRGASGDTLAQETQSANQAQYRNSGGAGEDRTPYLFNAIEALSQMSYSPTQLGGNIIHVFRACRS
jgi:hypothetical protein